MTNMPDRLPEGLENIVLKEFTVVTNEFAVKCDNCKRTLLNIVTNNSNEQEQKIRAECVNCNTKSFICTVKGRAFIGVPDNAELIDIQDNLFKVRPL